MLKPSRLYLYGLFCRLLPETSFFGLKRCLLRWCGAEIGDGVRICSSARILGAGILRIGADTWIGQQVLLMATGELSFGSRVDLGPMVYIGKGTHKLDFTGERCASDGVSLPVSIGDGCWLGARVTVLPGVSIGEMTMVAAGAVVTKPLLGHCLVAGVPAAVKRIASKS